jgi:HAD superfamily hydrolase (TIGR01509 family)
MTKFKVALFDVDGVLIIPPKLFSDIYCEKYGKDLKKLVPFYSSKEFKDSSIGKIDLKEAIRLNLDKWQWSGEIEDLISEWFDGENYPNSKLLNIIDGLRDSGVKVYIVTQQEKRRATFLRKKVFADKYDGFIVSCDLGLHKDTVEFWHKVVDEFGVSASDMIYFDDKQKLVDLACSIGINGYLFTTASEVEAVLK